MLRYITLSKWADFNVDPSEACERNKAHNSLYLMPRTASLGRPGNHGKERIIGFPILAILQMLEGAEEATSDSTIQKNKKGHQGSISIETFCVTDIFRCTDINFKVYWVQATASVV